VKVRCVIARRWRGFALVPALFLIVVVGLLAAVALHVTTAQQETVSLALQQARALAAARAGIDWAAYNAINGSCAGGTLSLSAASLAGFTVVVTCAATAYTDGAGSFKSFTIASTATFGNYGTADFVRRSVRATFTTET
jgi:MSHA biogenesis protein MshP